MVAHLNPRARLKSLCRSLSERRSNYNMNPTAGGRRGAVSSAPSPAAG
jgi:hypothetical protein